MPKAGKSPTHFQAVSLCARLRAMFDWSIVSLAMFCAVTVTLLSTRQLAAYTPDDPQVLAMVDKGIAYLEKSSHAGVNGMFEGGNVLTGYAVYKVTGDREHPLVQRAIKAAITRAEAWVARPPTDTVIYDVSLAALFLADVDPVLYRPQLISVRDFLSYHQKKHGGFGYLATTQGDTSQTQYAMLAIWAMHKNDIEVPVEMIEGALRYLVASQDPTGAWGYQAVVAPGSQLVPQTGVSKSLATAGISATLLGADALGLLGKTGIADDDPDVPKAFVRVDRKKEKTRVVSSTMKLDNLSNTVSRAVEYQRKNPYVLSGRDWYFYYRYSEERYESFLEVMNNKRDASPAWYNAGVKELKKLQDDQGAWGTLNSDHCPPDLCTAFAILYLIRSTQKTIAKLNEGVMAGGYGLPSNAGSVRRVGDRIVSEETASVEGLLELMEKDKTETVEIGLLPENLKLSSDPALRKAEVARLARLLSSRDWKSRRIAAKLLGRSEDINQVPELIYALTDPDAEVPVIAEESLRLLTRKLTVRHLESDAPPEKKREAANYWRDWYKSMRPDYVFLDK